MSDNKQLTYHLEPLRDARERKIAADVKRQADKLTPLLLMMLFRDGNAKKRD